MTSNRFSSVVVATNNPIGERGPRDDVLIAVFNKLRSHYTDDAS